MSSVSTPRGYPFANLTYVFVFFVFSVFFFFAFSLLTAGVPNGVIDCLPGNRDTPGDLNIFGSLVVILQKEEEKKLF